MVKAMVKLHNRTKTLNNVMTLMYSRTVYPLCTFICFPPGLYAMRIDIPGYRAGSNRSCDVS